MMIPSTASPPRLIQETERRVASASHADRTRPGGQCFAFSVSACCGGLVSLGRDVAPACEVLRSKYAPDAFLVDDDLVDPHLPFLGARLVLVPTDPERGELG